MSCILRFVFLFIFISIHLGIVPLETEVYIKSWSLPGNNVFTIKDASLDDGALLQIAPNLSGENQKFIISLRSGYFVIKAKHSGKLLTLVQDKDFIVQMYDLQGSSYGILQHFTMETRDSSIYCMKSRSKRTFLQFDYDYNFINGHWIKISDHIKQSHPTFGDPQRWVFVKVDSK